MIRCLNPREEELPEREKASHDRSNAYIVTKSPDRVLPPDRRVLPTDYLHGLYIELGGHQTIGTYRVYTTLNFNTCYQALQTSSVRILPRDLQNQGLCRILSHSSRDVTMAQTHNKGPSAPSTLTVRSRVQAVLTGTHRFTVAHDSDNTHELEG